MNKSDQTVRSKPAGTQSIRRAVLVLKAMAARNRLGLKLLDVARACQLEHPTAHRILQGLMAEGLVYQDENSRRYFLGPVVYELGLAAEPRFRLKELAAAALDRLAEQTGDTIFLAVPSGPDALCIDRREGSFPIKAFTVEVGTKLPMGVGVGGLAMLASLSDEERRHVMAQNMPRLAQHGDLSPRELLELVKEARLTGLAHNRSRAPGITALGVPILAPQGGVAGSISIAAIESRLPPDRASKIGRLMQAEAKAVATLLAQQAVAESGGIPPS